MFRDFRIFIALCLIFIFPHGILNLYFPDLRILIFLVEIPIFLLILTSIFFRAPQNGILKFTLINGLIFFLSFELSNYFTYLCVNNSKYFENWTFSILLGMGIIFALTLMTSLISKIVKNKISS